MFELDENWPPPVHSTAAVISNGGGESNCLRSQTSNKIRRPPGSRLENWVNSNNTGKLSTWWNPPECVHPRALTALPLNYARRLSNVFEDVASLFLLPPRRRPSPFLPNVRTPTNDSKPPPRSGARLTVVVSPPEARKKRRMGGSFGGIFSDETECKRTSRNVNLVTFHVVE